VNYVDPFGLKVEQGDISDADYAVFVDYLTKAATSGYTPVEDLISQITGMNEVVTINGDRSSSTRATRDRATGAKSVNCNLDEINQWKEEDGESGDNVIVHEMRHISQYVSDAPKRPFNPDREPHRHANAPNTHEEDAMGFTNGYRAFKGEPLRPKY
jgi:hypothetical protein